MKVRVVTIRQEGDTEIFVFATEKYLFNILKDKVRKWVDEDTYKEQQEVMKEIDDIATYDGFYEYTCEKFDVIIKVEEYEVIE